jgi:hypothetical protein
VSIAYDHHRRRQCSINASRLASFSFQIESILKRESCPKPTRRKPDPSIHLIKPRFNFPAWRKTTQRHSPSTTRRPLNRSPHHHAGLRVTPPRESHPLPKPVTPSTLTPAKVRPRHPAKAQCLSQTNLYSHPSSPYIFLSLYILDVNHQ